MESKIVWEHCLSTNVSHPKTGELCFPPKLINIDTTVYIYIYQHITHIITIDNYINH